MFDHEKIKIHQVAVFEDKPDIKKTWFKNYRDHLNMVSTEVGRRCLRFHHNSYQGRMSFFHQEKYTPLYALHDSYDFVDEVLGATILPVLAGLFALYNLSLSLFSINASQKKSYDHLSLFFTGLILGIGCLIRSIISLITRPLITLIAGWDKQSVGRFCPTDSLSPTLISML